jgi:hypothetical protein
MGSTFVTAGEDIAGELVACGLWATYLLALNVVFYANEINHELPLLFEMFHTNSTKRLTAEQTAAAQGSTQLPV